MSYFPLSRAVVCLAMDCQTVRDISQHRVCPECAEPGYLTVSVYLNRKAGTAHARATVAELDRLHVLKSA